MRAAAAALGFVALAALAQTCLVCGEVRAIREVHQRDPAPAARATPGSPSGLDTGPVVGTVAQFRFDRGHAEGWSFGASGTPEMQERLGATTYEVTVAMDIGETRTVRRQDAHRFRIGQRVALRGGDLEPM